MCFSCTYGFQVSSLCHTVIRSTGWLNYAYCIPTAISLYSTAYTQKEEVTWCHMFLGKSCHISDTVKPVAIYRSESWTMNKDIAKQLAAVGSNLTNHVVSSSQIIRTGHKRFSTQLKWVSTKVWNLKHRDSTVLWWNMLSETYTQMMYIPEGNKHNDWVLTWMQIVQQHGPSQLQFALFFQWVETCPSLVITRFLPSRAAVESAVTLALHHGLL